MVWPNFNFDIQFLANLALREKQIQQNYRPVIAVHKWFARRPGTLFPGLLLSEFEQGELKDIFYRANNLSGITVVDPFMGGGTPVLEANRLGCNVIGCDINPMASRLHKPRNLAKSVRTITYSFVDIWRFFVARAGRFYHFYVERWW